MTPPLAPTGEASTTEVKPKKRGIMDTILARPEAVNPEPETPAPSPFVLAHTAPADAPPNSVNMDRAAKERAKVELKCSLTGVSEGLGFDLAHHDVLRSLFSVAHETDIAQRTRHLDELRGFVDKLGLKFSYVRRF